MAKLTSEKAGIDSNHCAPWVFREPPSMSKTTTTLHTAHKHLLNNKIGAHAVPVSPRAANNMVSFTSG